MELAIEKTATQWMKDEVESFRKRRPTSEDPACGQRLQVSPAKWVLPKLLRIVYRNTDQSVEVLAPLIRTMLQEQAFASTGTDPCDCETLDESIDQTVSMLVSVLERVREHCLENPIDSDSRAN